MNNILIIGSGLSSGALIKYILEHATKYGWYVTVADSDLESAKTKIDGHPRGRATWLDVMKANDRRDLISRSDAVVTLLPAHLHLEVAHDCIRLNKIVVTSAYVSKELYRLGDEARDRSLVFMGEMSLDPGLENMAAMSQINKIKAAKGKLTSFKSYSGGLLSTTSPSNPWNYKFTWNPRNVVLSGQGTAQYLEDGKHIHIPYNRTFKEYEIVDVKGAGTFEAFANRDALLFREAYGLEDVPSIYRGTLRSKGFCDSWNALVQIGLTDGAYPILNSSDMTYYDLLEAFVKNRAEGLTLKDRIANYLGTTVNSKEIKNLQWLGLFSRKKIGIKNATPALMLEDLLRSKWEFGPKDKDMVLIQQVFEYTLDGKQKRLTSTLKLEGKNGQDTAMGKVIGLPMAILVKLIMQRSISTTGTNVSVSKEVYEPILAELASMDISFDDVERDI